MVATKNSTGGHGDSLRVSDHPNNPCLLHREVKGARHSGGEKMLMGSGQGFQLRPEMETNEADERWEGDRDRRGKGHADAGRLSRKGSGREKRHQCFKGQTGSNLTREQMRDPLEAREVPM